MLQSPLDKIRRSRPSNQGKLSDIVRSSSPGNLPRKSGEYKSLPQRSGPRQSLSGARITVETLREELIKFEQRLLPHLQSMGKDRQYGKYTSAPGAQRELSNDDSLKLAPEMKHAAPKQTEKSPSDGQSDGPMKAALRDTAPKQDAGEKVDDLGMASLHESRSLSRGTDSEYSPVFDVALPSESLLSHVEDHTVLSWGPCPAAPHKPCRELPVKKSSVRSLKHQGTYNMLSLDHSDEEEEEELEEIPDMSNASSSQEFVAALVTHPNFNAAVSVLIALNCVQIGWEVDTFARDPKKQLPSFCGALDMIFCFFFVLELSLRVFAHRGHFFRMPGWQWNMFDTTVVTMQVLDTLSAALMLSHMPLNEGVGRALKIIRITRIVRVMRLLNSVKDLRMLVVAIGGSLRTLIWVLFLLFLVLYAFSVFVTTLVTEQLEELTTPKDPKNIKALQSMFGSLLTTMYTLYQAICMGLDWGHAVHPMQEETSFTTLPLAFSFYMAIMVFALLNVITGVVLTSSVQAAEDDRQKSVVDQIRRFFRDNDINHVGTVSCDEFESYVHEPSFQDAVNSFGMSPDDARHLFLLLSDISHNQRVSPDHFIEASLRWCAPCKKMDYAFLQREIVSMSNEIKSEFFELSSVLKSDVMAMTALSTDIHEEIRIVNSFLDEWQQQQPSS